MDICFSRHSATFKYQSVYVRVSCDGELPHSHPDAQAQQETPKYLMQTTHHYGVNTWPIHSPQTQHFLSIVS